MFPKRMSPTSVLASVSTAALLGVLVGCAGVTGSGTEDTPGTDTPVDADLPADTAVLKVEQTGGFVTAQTNFSRVPDLAVYADGRAITPGPQIMIYPPPALPSLQFSELSAAQLEQITDAAEDAGLLDKEIDYGEPGIADATTTVVTIVEGDTTHVHEAYALHSAGTGGDVVDDDDPAVELPGLDEAAIEARATLTDFIIEATLIAGSGEGGAATVWEPESYSLKATPAQPISTDDADDDANQTDESDASDGSDAADGETTEGTATSDDELFGPALPWGIASIDLSSAADCVPVEEEAAAQLRELLAPANMLTRFEQAGTDYEVWVRPVFPDETACAVAK